MAPSDGAECVLEAERPARERGGVCFDPHPGKPKSGGGGSGGQRGSGSPGPSARESCIDVAGRERSSRGAKQTEAPAGSGAQSVPGTWGPSRRGVNRKQMRRLLCPVSWSGSGRLRRVGTCPRTGPPDTSPPTPQCGSAGIIPPFSCPLPQRVRALMRVGLLPHSPRWGEGVCVWGGGWNGGTALYGLCCPLPAWLPDLPVQLGKPDRPWVRTRD